MFGTLRSADRSRDGFEFIENPDPAAAISRNVQDKARIACLLCRSKKVRCSGGRNGCDRCATLGETCRYADQTNNAVNKPKRNSNRERRSVISPKATLRTRVDKQRSNDAEDERNFDSSIMDSMENTVFDIMMQPSLLSPWMMGSPDQLYPSTDGVVTATSDLRDEYSFDLSAHDFTTSSHSAITPSLSSSPSALLSSTPSVDPESLTLDTGEMPWALASKDLESALATRPMLTQGSREASVVPDSCNCLMRSVSLLERLAARSALHENRFDVLLSDVRYSIETMAAFIGCPRCVTRAEQHMLVAVTARQVGLVCKKMARCYRDLCARASVRGKDEASEQEAGTAGLDISIATYHVTRRERQHLLENLISMQMSELQQLISTIKSRYHDCSDRGHEEALQEADSHILAASSAMKATLA